MTAFARVHPNPSAQQPWQEVLTPGLALLQDLLLLRQIQPYRRLRPPPIISQKPIPTVVLKPIR